MENELSKIDFAEHFDKLVQWFKIKMTTEQTNMTYDKLKNYPVSALKFAVDYFIENGRPSPGFFPTTSSLVTKVWEWLDGNPEEKFKRMRFDAYEDYTYPVSKLWDGYRILMQDGMDKFNTFAQQNRMPQSDRDRVRMKVQVVKQGKGGEFNAQVAKLTGNAGRDA